MWKRRKEMENLKQKLRNGLKKFIRKSLLLAWVFALFGLSPLQAYSQSIDPDIKILNEALQSYEEIIDDLSKTIESFQHSQETLQEIEKSYYQLEIDYEKLLQSQEQLANDYKRDQIILGTSLGAVAVVSIVTAILVGVLPRN